MKQDTHYPTKLDKMELFYEHQSLFNHPAPKRTINRIRRPRKTKQLQFMNRRDYYLFR